MTEVVGRLVLADGVVPGRITVDDGWIAAVDLQPDDPRAAAGPLIAPGFIDVHVHGWGGHDATGDADALSGMARALLRRGVTSFLPTAPDPPRGRPPPVRRDRCGRWMPGAPDDGAQPLGFNLEGPFLAPARKGAHDAALLRTPAGIDPAMLEAVLDGLRIMTIAPELPGAAGPHRAPRGAGDRGLARTLRRDPRRGPGGLRRRRPHDDPPVQRDDRRRPPVARASRSRR